MSPMSDRLAVSDDVPCTWAASMLSPPGDQYVLRLYLRSGQKQQAMIPTRI